MVGMGLAVMAGVLSGGPRIQEGNREYRHNADHCDYPGGPSADFTLAGDEALDGVSHYLARGLGASAVLVRLALDSFDADPDDTVSVAGLSGDRVEAEQGISKLPQAAPQDAALGRAPATSVDGGIPGTRAAEADEEVIDGIHAGESMVGEIFWITTYTCEEGYCGFTANNIQVAEYTLEGYRMAACSEHYAFGTRFLVAGRWLVECQDRGSGVVLPNHLDVYFPTAEEAAAWLAQVGDHAKVEVMP